MTRLKLAELTSDIGALVLGVGLEALFSRWFAPAAGFIAVAGVAAHGFWHVGQAPLGSTGTRRERAVDRRSVLGLLAAAGGRSRAPVRPALRGHGMATGTSLRCTAADGRAVASFWWASPVVRRTSPPSALLWESGVGADVSARTAAPVVGGLWSCMLLTLLVLPAAYAMWRRHQVRVAQWRVSGTAEQLRKRLLAAPCDVKEG